MRITLGIQDCSKVGGVVQHCTLSRLDRYKIAFGGFTRSIAPFLWRAILKKIPSVLITQYVGSGASDSVDSEHQPGSRLQIPIPCLQTTHSKIWATTKFMIFVLWRTDYSKVLILTMRPTYFKGYVCQQDQPRKSPGFCQGQIEPQLTRIQHTKEWYLDHCNHYISQIFPRRYHARFYKSSIRQTKTKYCVKWVQRSNRDVLLIKAMSPWHVLLLWPSWDWCNRLPKFQCLLLICMQTGLSTAQPWSLIVSFV